MCRTQHFYVIASWIDYVSVFALVKQNNMFVENSRTISTADYRKPLKYVLMERMFHQMWEETELISCQSFKLNCSALNLLDSRSTLRLTYEIEIQISKLGPRNIWLKYQISKVSRMNHFLNFIQWTTVCLTLNLLFSTTWIKKKLVSFFIIACVPHTWLFLWWFPWL